MKLPAKVRPVRGGNDMDFPQTTQMPAAAEIGRQFSRVFEKEMIGTGFQVKVTAWPVFFVSPDRLPEFVKNLLKFFPKTGEPIGIDPVIIVGSGFPGFCGLWSPAGSADSICRMGFGGL